MIEGARNQIAFILIDSRNGERTIIWDRDDRLAYRAADAPLNVATRGASFISTPMTLPQVLQWRIAAHEAGTIVTADIDNAYEGLLDLLPLIDVLITSRELPHRVTGLADERASLVEMKARFGCSLVGMTMGKRGALLYCEGQFLESPAYEVPGGCRDTTGAGDAFHGGFLYGLLRGEEIETCLKLANATAALKCRELGARTALPNSELLESFLSSPTSATLDWIESGAERNEDHLAVDHPRTIALAIYFASTRQGRFLLACSIFRDFFPTNSGQLFEEVIFLTQSPNEPVAGSLKFLCTAFEVIRQENIRVWT